MKNTTILFFVFLFGLFSCKKEDSGSRPSSVLRLCATPNPVYEYKSGNDSIKLFIPSVITPNGDGNNDVFKVFGYLWLAQSMQFVVSDSLGNALFTSSNLYDEWNGMINGSLAPETNYLVSLTGTTVGGHSFNLQGSLSVINCFSGNMCANQIHYTVNCDTCMWPNQWDGYRYNTLLNPNEFFVNDTYLSCD